MLFWASVYLLSRVLLILLIRRFIKSPFNPLILAKALANKTTFFPYPSETEFVVIQRKSPSNKLFVLSPPNPIWTRGERYINYLCWKIESSSRPSADTKKNFLLLPNLVGFLANSFPPLRGYRINRWGSRKINYSSNYFRNCATRSSWDLVHFCLLR